MGNKRIYLGRESSKYAKIAGGAIVTITSLFFVLMVMGFEITGSDDQCLGTLEDPCISYGKICNLGPDNYDIYNPEGFKMDFSPTIKDHWIFFKDGRVKKQTLYDLGVNASTAGWRYENFTNATKPRKDRIYVHRFAAYKCQDYMLVGLKENPDDVIKWGIGTGGEYLDPFWYGVNDTANISAGSSINVEMNHAINISTNITGATRVCVDIDHPDYGDNYTCGSPSADFIFDISYFRNNVFNDSTTSKLFSFAEVTTAEYGESGSWESGHDYVLAHDDNWFTYATPLVAFGMGDYYANYSIPPNIDNTSIQWHVKDENSSVYLDVPIACVDPYGDSKVVFNVDFTNVVGAGSRMIYYCYNSTGDWHILQTTTEDYNMDYLYENEIVWSEDPEWAAYEDVFGFSVNALDDVLNISFNLTGGLMDSSMPTNIRFKINGTLSNTIPLLVDGYSNLQNITESTGTASEEDYWPLEGSCQGSFYSSVPGVRGFDEETLTYAQANGAANITWVFDKSESGTTDTDFYIKSGVGRADYYCQEVSAWTKIGKSTAMSTTYFEIPDTCNNASLSNITIRGELGTSDMVYEGYLKWTTDGSNHSFNLDGQATRVATLKLPSQGTVTTAIFNVSGSISEDFVDQQTSTSANYGWVISATVEASQEFIPDFENLTAVWVYLQDSSTTDLKIEVGTTAGGAEKSSDTFSVGTYGSLGSWAKFDLTNSVLTTGTSHYVTLSSAGNSVVWKSLNTNPYADGYAYINGVNNTANDFLLKTVMFDLATDPKITIGDLDTSYEWNATGNYSGNTQSSDLAANITEYLTDCSPESDGYCLVPFYLLSSTPGKLRVHSITINNTYDPNPVYLDVDILSDFLDGYSSGDVQIPIQIITGSAGNITINDVRIDYAGGNDTIDVLVFNATDGEDRTVNETLSLNVYYSKFLRVLPYTWTENIYFLPRSNSSKNVTAYGQTSIKPIFNITTQNYGGKNMNLSIKINDSISCLNITWNATGNTKPSGNKMNTTWQQIAGGLELDNNTNIWLWADLENCDASDQRILRPSIYLESYCVDCVGAYP